MTATFTTEEIYKLATETTEGQFENLVNGLNADEQKNFNSLVRLGDTKEVALWTVVSKRYTSVEYSEMYKTAYKS